jgi:hypothetical protein
MAAPGATQRPNKPTKEYAISDADYDEILRVIRDMVKVFERSPSVFRQMKEEDFRTILMVALNGVFQGSATGETFNGAGKTDILIRAENKNVFIAECLMWKGPEYFRGKLTDQLFKYATWRDSKLAAIVFNRGTNHATVVDGMKKVVSGLPTHRGWGTYSGEGTAFRCRLHREDDPQQEFTLTCLAFPVPETD